MTRPRFAGLVAIVVALSGCGTPNSVTVSQMPADAPPDSAASAVAQDPGSDMAVPDEGGVSTSIASGTDSSLSAESPAALGPEGAFDSENGRPLRVLVRPDDSDEWHWIDSQTGAYIAPGDAPASVAFDEANLVAARAAVAENCEDEGSGLHVSVGHATVQKSGRYIASEALFQNTDCSGEPFAWRAVAIDRATGVPVVRFRLGDGATAVTELEYDSTGTWLLITLADGSIEWQGGSGRVELEPQDQSGAVISVAEASWGTEPPFGPVPGRVFVPNANGDGSAIDQLVFPPARISLEHGGDAWAVVLGADENLDAGLTRGVQAAASAGFEAVASGCDRNDAEAFGWTAGGAAVAVFFSSEGDARRAAQLFERAGIPAAPSLVSTFCLD